MHILQHTFPARIYVGPKCPTWYVWCSLSTDGRLSARALEVRASSARGVTGTAVPRLQSAHVSNVICS